MWVAQWTDRINFLRRLAPPPATHDNQMGFVYKCVLPAAIVLHGIMAIKFFYDICDSSSIDLNHTTAATLDRCSNALSAGTTCSATSTFGPTLREDAIRQLNGTLDASPYSLLCIASNYSGDVRSFCHVRTRGLSAVCGDTSWTSAKVSPHQSDRVPLPPVAPTGVVGRNTCRL